MVRWIVVLTLAAAGACTLFDEDLPDDTCKSDNDCFRAQGEFCNQQTHNCELRMMLPIDAGVDAAPDAPADAAPDAMVDAMVDAP